jgi:hypothetical protein
MCGIVGMAGDVTAVKYEKMFKDMLVMDVLRGEDSTGAITVSPNGNHKIAKAALLPPDLFQMKQFKNAMKGQMCAMIGHNRAATVGDVNYHGAHPFEHGDIVGVHNGTLQEWRADLDESSNFDVDSDCLIYNIAKNGAKETFESIRGAWACVWYDKSDHTINMIRNDKRPLFLGHTKAMNDLFFASEEWMLHAAGSRNSVSMEKVYQLREDIIYSWKLPEKGGVGLGKPNARSVSPLPPKTYHYGNHQGDHWMNRRPARGSTNSTQHGNTGKQQTSQKKGQQEQVIGKPPANPPAVIPINRDKQNAIIDRHKAEFDELQGKPVYFYAQEFVLFQNSDMANAKRNGYVFGIMVDQPHHDIKVYCSEDDASILLDHEGELYGDVTGYSSSWLSQTGDVKTGHLTVSYDSIDFVDDRYDDVHDTLQDSVQDTEEDVLTEGPFGRMIDREEFNRLAKDGCGVCSDAVDFEDEYCWFNSAPICADCAEDELPRLQGEA